jgi:hypothetical protein
MHYVDAILQMITNCNKVFMMCSTVEAGNFTTQVQSTLLIISKKVLKMIKTLQKNSLMIAKDV